METRTKRMRKLKNEKAKRLKRNKILSQSVFIEKDLYAEYTELINDAEVYRP